MTDAEKKQMLSKLRSPWGFSADEVREARHTAADLIKEQEEKVKLLVKTLEEIQYTKQGRCIVCGEYQAVKHALYCPINNALKKVKDD